MGRDVGRNNREPGVCVGTQVVIDNFLTADEANTLIQTGLTAFEVLLVCTCVCVYS